MTLNFIPQNKVEVPTLNFKSEIKLRSNKTAVIVVDMQNDFVKKDGRLLVPMAKATISNMQQLVTRARKKDIRIIYTQDTHFEGDKEWTIWPEHCRKGTKGWKIINELKPLENEKVFEKNRYDGFYGTNLEHYLKYVWSIENLVIVGTVSSICVLHTAASAGLRWYNVIVPADGISSLTDFDQAMTLRQVSTLYTGTIVKSCKGIVFA